ncbi:glutamate-rich protein 1 [Gouania willdenowi]|uniref:glutamate-rich protein 1 n=1 Tax=Gouania willdenowi TaxID=441366 RepID=UPI001055AACB|nr:glutamate-rich protein 1 [Gouania willdenowi]
MARRKDVFHSKVLQKLYPPPPKEETSHIPQCFTDSSTKKTHEKRKVKQQSGANQSRRMYTVLPPPPGFDLHSQESATPFGTQSRNSAEDPVEDIVYEATEDAHDEEEDEEQIGRKRKRRKRKAANHPHSEKDTPLSTVHGQTAGVEGGESLISKNKKRKLKKKRHKEKLLSMGLMPRANALEFTYQKDVQGHEEQVEEEQEEDGKSAAEVTDFLRRTLEMCKSDSKASHLSAPLDDLLQSIVSRSRPERVLGLLHSLKAFVQGNERDKLEEALKELHNNCDLSAGETSAIISLFQYWITDILPLPADEKTRLSSTHHH